MIYAIIWAHCIADFFMETDDMAKNKSSSNKWLLKHICNYHKWMCFSLAVYGFLYAIISHKQLFSFFPLILYVSVNAIAHFFTDYVTSRITKRLWAEKRVHDFFAVIGVDQALHMTVLVATMPILKL